MAQSTLTLHAPEAAPGPVAPDAPPGGRRYRVAVAALLLVAAGAWFAPAVVARSGLRNRLVHAVLPEHPGTASVGGASLGWLGPVVLRDVSLSDAGGAELLRLDELRTSRSLAALLLSSGDDLGTITLTRPAVSIRLRPDGSNLEDTLRPILESGGSAAGLTVVIDDGRVRWTATDGSPSAGGIERVAGTVRRASGSPRPDRINLKAVLSDGERGGDLSLLLGPAAKRKQEVEATLKVADAPLTPIQPWLDRFDVGITAVGTLSADLLATAAGGETGWRVDGTVEGHRLRLTLGRLGDTPVLLESVVVKGAATAGGDRVTIENVELRSDVGSATAAGELRLASLTTADSWPDRLRAALEQDVTLSASIDLTRLGPSLPNSFGPDQTIESGRVDLQVRTAAEGDGRTGTLRLLTSEIVAGPPDRRIVWRDPLSAELRLRSDGGGISVERLAATSEFLSVTGSGSTDGGELRVQADLDTLRDRLGRFVELPAGALAGQVTGRLALRRAGDVGRVTAEADGTVRNLSLAVAGRRWTERELVVALRAEAMMRGTRIETIEAGGVTARSAEGDECVASLRQPVACGDEAEWPLAVTLKGDLARWTDRARAWGASPLPEGWSAGGTIDATASVLVGDDSLAVADAVAEAKDLELRFDRRSIGEPYVRLAGEGSWDGPAGVLTVPTAKLVSETATIDAADVRLPIRGDRPASGRIAFRGGIGRIARYLLSDRPPVWLSGVAAGTIDLSSDAVATVAEAAVELERPVLSRPVATPDGRAEWRPVWSDERASVQLAARYHHLGEALELKAFRVAGSGIAADAAGRIDRLTTVADADLTGTLDCDLEAFRSRLAIELPDGVTAAGRRAKPFAIRGPLRSGQGVDPALRANAGVGWDRIDLFGLSVGEGELTGALSNRVVAFGPFGWPVGDGRVRGSAAVSLAEVPTLTVAKGRVAEEIALTPEICRSWLRYAAPSLADAATVQGRASFDVTGCSVPLADPQRAEAEGVLVLGGADATPGPLVRSLLDVVRQVQLVAGRDPTSGSDLRLVAPAQDVRVRVAGGRVFHDRLSVRLGDEDGPTVATSGSIGFDDSLDLIAEVPLDAAWFKDERIAAALGGQVLRVPVRGTLSHPAPDPRALQDFARRAAAGAVNGLLDRQIEKQIGDPLRKLFDK